MNQKNFINIHNRYRHAITGAKSRTADDSPGGILADDMGLGKTLTMLSAIMGSLTKAEEFANTISVTEGSDMRKEPPRYMKATLVVVPSERGC